MTWHFNTDDCSWVTSSCVTATHDDDHFSYRITVTEYGSFSVSDSADELKPGKWPTPFLFLKDAKKWCLKNEASIRRQSKSAT